MQQHTIQLRAKKRGFHLITDEILREIPDLGEINAGLCHLQLLHTSASLMLNESYDPDVRVDMESWANRVAQENEPWYVHTMEGSDDMPAHIKSALFGTSLTVPIQNGRWGLGTWQGIWLGEHRNHASGRRILVTVCF